MAAYAHSAFSLAPHSPISPTIIPSIKQDQHKSVLHPRLAVFLGIAKCWHLPLLFCRALSVAPALWSASRCILTLFIEFLSDPKGIWSLQKRLSVTEVFLTFVWSCSAAWLSFNLMDCLMSRWLLNYTPQATLIRLSTVNCINIYMINWSLRLSGAYLDPSLLLIAWIINATILTLLSCMIIPRLAIVKETSGLKSIFSATSFISLMSLLFQLHLTGENDNLISINSIDSIRTLGTGCGESQCLMSYGT